MQNIVVRPLESTDIAEVVDLLIAQMSRFSRLDSRLELFLTTEQIAVSLREQCDNMPNPSLVAQNQDGRIRGYVHPSLYQLPPDSTLLACYTSRNGTFQQCILPEPTAPDALAVASALLSVLNRYWREQRTLADLFHWPSGDQWLEPLLLEDGFLADGVLAYHSLSLLSPSCRPCIVELSTRLARPEDEEALVELHLAEVAFHLPYTPFCHLVPAVEIGFRKSLDLLWKGKSLQEGAPLVLVGEYKGKVVAMAESYLQQVTQESPRRRLPPGRYGYLNSVSVREEMQRKGVGRVLVQAIFDAFAPLTLDGYTLWFNCANPLSGPFWSHLGFLPLWTRYTRLKEAQR